MCVAFSKYALKQSLTAVRLEGQSLSLLLAWRRNLSYCSWVGEEIRKLFGIASIPDVPLAQLLLE